MSAGVVILLLVPPGETQAPLVSGLVSAASRSLGSEARVLIDARVPTSDDEAVSLAEQLHVHAVVTLRWLDDGRVSLHAHWSGQPGWTDRFFSFHQADALDERGRTIGFTLATMVRTESPLGPALDTPAPRPSSAAAAAGTGARPAASRSWSSGFALEAGAQVHLAPHATAFGGELRAVFFPAPRLGLTAGAAFSTGAMNDLDGRLRVIALAAGVRIPIVAAREGRPYEFAVGGEALLSHEAVARHGPREHTEGRWLPGARLRLSAAWFFTPHIAAVAGFGVQANLGETDIVVNGRTEATLSAYRGLGELGVRARF